MPLAVNMVKNELNNHTDKVNINEFGRKTSLRSFRWFLGGGGSFFFSSLKSKQ